MDEVSLLIHTEPAIHREIWDHFSFFAENAVHSEAYKEHKWDGMIHLYNLRNQRLPCGLGKALAAFCKDRGYELQGDQYLASNYSIFDAVKHAESLQLTSADQPITAYEHQIMALTKAIRYRRCVLESSTSSGKSLIIYMIARFLVDRGLPGLIIVPRIGLVKQMMADFKDYSRKNGWKAERHVHCVQGGIDPHSDKMITITTWQSIKDLEDESFFRQFSWVIGDEAHNFAAKSLVGIMERLTNAKYRVGMTGTVQDGEVHRLTLEGYFGPIVKVVSNKELMDKKLIADLTIKALVLNYNANDCALVSAMTYQDELKWLTQNESRNRFIVNLALSLQENTLILVQLVEHGQTLYEQLLAKAGDGRPIYFVFGKTDVDTREEIRHLMETHKDAILVASYGTFQEGISIKHLFNLIAASPSKSKVRVLQSIGRALRKSATKMSAVMFDISDDLRYQGRTNYTLKHYVERIKLYAREQFKVKVYNIAIGGQQ